MTVQSLLGVIFADLEVLGSSYLLRDSDATSLRDVSMAQWEAVLGERYPEAVFPFVAYDLERIFAEARGDGPIELLRLACLLWEATDDPPMGYGSRFPVQVFANLRPRVQAALGFDVADCHLHSGASAPLAQFLRVLATQSGRVSARANDDDLLSMTCSTGRTWDMAKLLAACRWCTRLLWLTQPKAMADQLDSLADAGLAPDLVVRVMDGTFWKLIRQAVLGEEDRATELLGPLNAAFPVAPYCPPVSRLFWKFRTGRALAGPPAEAFLLGYVRVVSAISSLLMSRRAEGLSRFTDRFRMVAALRGGMSRDSGLTNANAKMIEWTLDHHIAPIDEVVGAELRKTVSAKGHAEFGRELRQALSYHSLAFVRHLDEHPTRSLSMPVGFARQRSSTLNPAEVGLKELAHVVGGCEALQRLYSDPQIGEDAIGAIHLIDVADDEVGSNNWPFCLGAQILGRLHVPLVFAIHAGESFTTELNGIRRVGELYLGEVAPMRIGHALALSGTAATRVLERGRPPMITSEAIVDLAWIIAAGLDEAGDARALLSKVTTVGRTGGDPIGPEAWAEAFCALHHLDQVEGRLLFMLPAPRVVSDPEEREGLAGKEPWERALAALSWSAPPRIAGCDVAQRLEPALEREMLAVSNQMSRIAREMVMDLVHDHGTVVEACPTSNATLAGLRYDDHPIWEWTSPPHSLKVVLGSDDPLMLGAMIADEYRRLAALDRERDVLEAVAAASTEVCSGGPKDQLNAWRSYARLSTALGVAVPERGGA